MGKPGQSNSWGCIFRHYWSKDWEVNLFLIFRI